MNLFERFVNFFDYDASVPKIYSWYHLLCVALVITAVILLWRFFGNCSDKVFRRIILISWAAMVCTEIMKQLVFSFEFDGVTASWDFPWYSFPFQLCSTPMYVLPFVAFLKDSPLRDGILIYMATFSFFGGLAVYAYPEQVFVETLFINFQTMLHHGIQLVIGAFIVIRYKEKFTKKCLLYSCGVFLTLCATALFLDILFYNTFIRAIDETFNMFYFSPYFDCTLPVLSLFSEKIPYIVFLLIYILGFSFISLVIFWVEKKFINLSKKRKAA